MQLMNDVWDLVGGQPAPSWWTDKFRGDYMHLEWNEVRKCIARGHGTIGPGVLIMRNGAKQVVEHCLDCGERAGTFLPASEYADQQLPLVRDNRLNSRGCRHRHTEPVIVITSDGRSFRQHRCKYCPVLIVGTIEATQPGDRFFLDVVDRRVDDNGFAIAPPCEHCGAHEGTQLHHWAPKALFDDPDRWPVAHLCVECHAYWHRVTRTNSVARSA